jgi:hypothetical protein
MRASDPCPICAAFRKRQDAFLRSLPRRQAENWSRRKEMKLLAIAAVVGVTLLTGATSSSASVEYPWCIITGGRDGGVMSCGYVSYAQCMQTRIGTDMCVQNPRFQALRR